MRKILFFISFCFMRLLLVFISFLFAYIFFLFFQAGEKNDILQSETLQSYPLQTYSPDLFIWSAIFFTFGLLFFFYFSDFTHSKILIWKKEKYIEKLVIFLFLGIIYYYHSDILNSFVLMLSSFFILINIFFFQAVLCLLKKQRKIIKILGIISSYIGLLCTVLYLFSNDHIIAYIFLLYIGIFNILIHKKYGNYISLLFGILAFLFFTSFLYFYIFELYIESDNIYMTDPDQYLKIYTEYD